MILNSVVRIKFIDLPELKPIIDDLEVIENLRSIQLDNNLVALSIIPAFDDIIMDLSNGNILYFKWSNIDMNNKVQKSSIGFRIISTDITEFIREQLSPDLDTLFIPKLVKEL